MKYFYLLGLIAVLSFAACSDNNEELNEIVLGHQSAVSVSYTHLTLPTIA